MGKIIFTPAGDQAIVVELGQEINKETNERIRGLVNRLQGKKMIIEMIPTYCSLLIYYDYRRITYTKLKRLLEKELTQIEVHNPISRKIHPIPVCYDVKFGIDLLEVANYTGLSIGEIIALHSKPEYLIYMLGFLPGFAYLGGLDPRIHCPRLTSPRVKILAGSVGIGGEQTGIYPLDSPGGWRLIGRTPLRPYTPQGETTILYEMGEFIQFYPITIEEYDSMEKDIARGVYRHEIIEG